MSRYRAWTARRARVEEFERQYRAWTDAVDMVPDENYYYRAMPDEPDIAAFEKAASDAATGRTWLLARRDQCGQRGLPTR